MKIAKQIIPRNETDCDIILRDEHGKTLYIEAAHRTDLTETARVFFGGSITMKVGPFEVEANFVGPSPNKYVEVDHFYPLPATPPADHGFPTSFWLEMVIPSDVSADFIANLEEVFTCRWVPKFGRRRATWLWYSQCVQMAVRHWWYVAWTALDRLPNRAGTE